MVFLALFFFFFVRDHKHAARYGTATMKGKRTHPLQRRLFHVLLKEGWTVDMLFERMETMYPGTVARATLVDLERFFRLQPQDKVDAYLRADPKVRGHPRKAVRHLDVLEDLNAIDDGAPYRQLQVQYEAVTGERPSITALWRALTKELGYTPKVRTAVSRNASQHMDANVCFVVKVKVP